MQFPEPIPVQILAERLGAKLLGDRNLVATGINEIHKVTPGDVTFSDVAKYFQTSLNSAASIIILNSDAVECPEGKAILVVDEPFVAYNGLIEAYRPFEPLTVPVHHRAVIHPTAIVEPGCVIADNVVIGPHCYIQANAYLGEYTYLGAHVRVGVGAILGTDAFYFKKKPDGTFTKWRSGGRVIVHDHVDIGSGCTINKGVSGDTIIGQGTKIDCLVHIGHGAVVGKNCLIAAQVGIAGKTILEDNVVLYGQVGIAQNLHIGAGAIVLAKSGVSKSLAGGKVYFGTPAQENSSLLRQFASLRSLPEWRREVDEKLK